ncbi:Ribonuclease HII [hydrothermal vent metagenome]|uniref:Ribonuclease HII n=1 Tax=hydrothermal vent metagenome TaxID=652676 RepID=A0A3B0VWN4_9ZZZZ
MRGGKGTAVQQSLFPLPRETDRFSFERDLTRRGFQIIAGTDEAGRGPLAGPVVAASVILPVDCDYQQFNDSKKLTAKARNHLYDVLRDMAVSIGVSIIPETVIDRINILQASLLAMKESLEALSVSPDFVLVDGKFSVPAAISQQALVKGDSRSASIAAASIIAKVTRDEIMVQYHRQYPQYNFCKNKGYPTAEHRRVLAAEGPCPLHRRSFAGVKGFFESGPDPKP